MTPQPHPLPRQDGPAPDTAEPGFRQALQVMTVLVPVAAIAGVGLGGLTDLALGQFDRAMAELVPASAAPRPAAPPPFVLSSPLPPQEPQDTGAWSQDTAAVPAIPPAVRPRFDAWLAEAASPPWARPAEAVIGPKTTIRPRAGAAPDWAGDPASDREASERMDVAVATPAPPAPVPAPEPRTTIAEAPSVPPPSPPAAPAPAPANRAFEVLLQQADMWQSRNEPERARDSLRRALLLAPGHPEAEARLRAMAPSRAAPWTTPREWPAQAAAIPAGVKVAFTPFALTPPVAPAPAPGPRQVLALRETLLRREPANMAARQDAVQAALALNERVRARQLAQDGLRQAPNDPQAWLVAADLERGLGEEARATRHLERARDLQAQLASYRTPAPGRAYAAAAPGRGPGGATGTAPVVVMALVDDAADEAGALGPLPLQPGAPARPRPARPVAPAAPAPAPLPANNDPDPWQTPFVNPFRRGGEPAMRTADTTLTILPRDTDPLLRDIDRDIATLRNEVAPWVQGGLDIRGRSGDSGTSRLTQYTTPLQANFSPGGTGRLRIDITPTILDAGRLDGNNPWAYSSFGSTGLALQGSGTSVTYGGPTVPSQQASGVGLGLAYLLNSLKVDVGSSPLGFPTTNVLGGIEWAPQLTEKLRLRLTGERRAIEDSLLSYAGTRDPVTGQTWGGVTRTGGRAQLELSAGPMELHAGVGGAMLRGRHVQDNSMVTVQAGGSLPLWKTPTQELRGGLELTYFQYAKNLSGYTLGQGGYFSPQSYVSAIMPITYREQVNDWLSWEVGVGAGVQSYRSSSSDYFPLDPALQGAWAAKAATMTGMTAQLPASSKTGFAGSARAAVDYAVSPSLTLSGRFGYQQVGNFREATGMLVAKYVFNGATP
ncbi:Cellulose synthase operon protein C [Rhodovastum atsumiense]|nr:cellulose synthase subunit BcsC-related outer membrane protein [Rhodovastum atsumiense]CAH2602385.1 Cellulose synthase operon protein C [Rhodovastum atsumiense]